MVEKGESSESNPGLARCGSFRDEENFHRQATSFGASGSRNTSPLGQMGSRNTSPSRQKGVKTKPRGLNEETLATFSKAIQPDIQMKITYGPCCQKIC